MKFGEMFEWVAAWERKHPQKYLVIMLMVWYGGMLLVPPVHKALIKEFNMTPQAYTLTVLAIPFVAVLLAWALAWHYMRRHSHKY